ncbi:MAG: tRNA pseudouridine(55) synthase TruB [Pantoea sp. Brub]|nr:tRNA pseudouridine(55) synthase TruB [Pantoea sp. Brub]
MHFNSNNINGILLVDKPKGISSNYALQTIKNIFKVSKAGYVGTLDPLATGLLPICFGEAAKFSKYLSDSDKYYQVIARLGQKTNTLDADGVLLNIKPINFNKKELNIALESFKGDSLQIPPMFSALKYKGRPLYFYARQGINIKRKPRLISIYELKFIRWQYDELELEIHCSKGVYIRTIIDDLGEKLGCYAHVIELRRIRIANYFAKNAITINKLLSLIMNKNYGIAELLNSLILPIDSQLSHFPTINLLPKIVSIIKTGQTVQINNLSVQGLVRLTEGKQHRFFGVAKVSNNYIVPVRLLMNS